FQYLQPLLGFHLYLYGIETAFAWLGNQGLPSIICEILAPRSDLVRKAAVGSYLDNDGIGERAVRKFIDVNVFSDPQLKAILKDDTLDDVAKTDYLAEHLARSVSLKKRLDTSNPRKMKELFYAFARKLYRGGTADGLTSLATGCGLVSKRGTNRYRY